MKTQNIWSTQLILALGSVGLVTGCMTAPSGPAPGKEDPLAAARAKAYLESAELVAADEKIPEAKTCTVPPVAEKFVPLSPDAGPSKEWKTLISYANACVKQKNWKTLEQLANSIARIDINSPWGAYFLSVSAEGSGDLLRALWMAELAQKKAGGRSGLYAYQKGRLLFEMKETTRAMQEMAHAVSLEAHLAEGYYFLGQIHDRDLETDVAMKNYQAALDAQPAHYGALTAMAELKISANAGAEAAALYTKAIESHPDQLKPWVRLGYIYETLQKNPAQALATYRGLKSSLDSGSLHDRPDFDLNAKIKTLETQAQARVPAQASTAPVPAAKTVK